MRTDSSKNDILYRYLETLCKCYSSGHFGALFPLLAEDSIYESQWVLTPNTGKDAIMEYLIEKGKTIREHNCCPTCTIVELVGNLNPIHSDDVHLNSGGPRRASIGLWYPDGKLAMLMTQSIDGNTNAVVVDLQLTEDDLIARIDLCMPELFQYKHFAGPFEISTKEEIPTMACIEAAIRRMLEAGNDGSCIDEYVEDHADAYKEDLAEFAFRSAVQLDNVAYVQEHINDIELNDEGGYSSYLYETEDETMQKLLMDHGAFKSWDDYMDCRFAYETVNGDILAFDPAFQKEVFEKYKQTYHLTDDKILAFLTDEDAELEELDLEEDMSVLGVYISEDGITFADKCGDGGSELMELLERLGWDCFFEGDSWKLETLGVYFID